MMVSVPGTLEGSILDLCWGLLPGHLFLRDISDAMLELCIFLFRVIMALFYENIEDPCDICFYLSKVVLEDSGVDWRL